MLRPRQGSNASASDSMDDSFSSSSSSLSSPQMQSSAPNNEFDLSYLLSLSPAGLSSSDTQSQGPDGSPSDGDWAASSSHWPYSMDGVDPFKWNSDTLLNDTIINPNDLFVNPANELYAQPGFSSLPSFSVVQPSPKNEYTGLPTPVNEAPPPAPYTNTQPQVSAATTPQPTMMTATPLTPPQDDIASRARERAGVQYAMPANGMHMSTLFHYASGAPLPPFHSSSPNPPVPSSSSSFSTSSNASGSPEPEPTSVTATAPLAASSNKTPHTTIERRYRTNLNTQITALRHSIPALRHLEADRFPNDVPDERGYIDGVKAARKASKGSIFSKATEYIRVLKRRELRLRRDFEGLRSLVDGLVGGPSLFAEWEREWRARYGAEDSEEVNSDVDGDDEDGSEEEDEKPKKKAKATPAAKKSTSTAASRKSSATAAAPSSSSDPVSGDLKRKRGRPRKATTPTEAPSTQPSPAAVRPMALDPQLAAMTPQFMQYTPAQLIQMQQMQQQQQQQQQQAQQGGGKYLLGVFLLFSFFERAPSSSSFSATSSSASSAHTHVGRVLTSIKGSKVYSKANAEPHEGLFVGDVMSTLHLVVSIVLLVSVIVSIFPSTMRLFRRTRHSATQASAAEDLRPASSSSKLGQVLLAEGGKDIERLREALNCEQVGVFRVTAAVLSASWTYWISGLRRQVGAVDSDVLLQRRAWAKLAGLELLQGHALPFSRRVYTAATLSSHISQNPSASEVATLALITYPFSLSSFSTRTWARAQRLPLLSKHERMLFSCSLSDAVELYNHGKATLASCVSSDEEHEDLTPLGLVASGFVCGRLRDAASELFVKTVSMDENLDRTPVPESVEYPPSTSAWDLEEVVDLGKALTKQVQRLTKLWEECSLAPTSASALDVDFVETEGSDASDALSETRALLEAIVLYRRLSSSSHDLSLTPVSPDCQEMMDATCSLFVDLGNEADAVPALVPSSPISSSSSSSNSSMSSSSYSSGSSTPTEASIHNHHSSSSSLSRGAGKSLLVSSSSSSSLASLGSVNALSPRLALLRILASPVFDKSLETEDARDKMVDWLSIRRSGGVFIGGGDDDEYNDEF